MTETWLLIFGMSLAITLLIESGFGLLFRKRGQAMVLLVLANVLTNPLVVLAVRVWGAPAALMEALAVLTEGLIYQKSREFSRPYLFSLGANALSFGIGIILNHVL